MAVINAVGNNLTGQTGTGAFVGATSPTITTPRIVTGINDLNGAGMFLFDEDTLPVNYFQFANSNTGLALGLSAVGSDTNIILSISGKGSGGVQTQGTTAGGEATAGFVGEFITSHKNVSSGVSLTTNIAADMTSISLTAGDWDVSGNIFFTASVSATLCLGWASVTSASSPDNSFTSGSNGITATAVGVTLPVLRVNVTGTTTVYASALATFGSGTCTVSGTLSARRIR